MWVKIPTGITSLLDEVETQFQRLSPNFDDGHHNGTAGVNLKVYFEINNADRKAITWI